MSESSRQPSTVSSRRPASARLVIGTILLIASGSVGAVTLHNATWVERAERRAEIPAVTNAGKATAQLHDAVGTFATGNDPGDRFIVVSPDSKVTFYQLGAAGPVDQNTDTYRLGTRDKKYYLVTGSGDAIELVDIDTVSYFGDTYRRR